MFPDPPRCWEESLLKEVLASLEDELLTMTSDAHKKTAACDRSLAGRVFFKFYMSVLRDLLQRGVRMHTLYLHKFTGKLD